MMRLSRARRTIVAGILGLLCFGATLAGPIRARGWKRFDSEHFTTFSNAGNGSTVRIVRTIERFRAALATFFTQLTVDSPAPTYVYVFKHDNAFAPYKPGSRKAPRAVAGYVVTAPDGNFIGLNGDVGIDSLDVVYHEYTHHVLLNNLPRLPSWFQEGLAECFSTFEFTSGRAKLGLQVDRHLRFLQRRTLLPLDELTLGSHESGAYNEGDWQFLFYAQSWALVHYLWWGRPGGKEQLGILLEEIVQGADPARAIEEVLGLSPEALQQELRQYVDQRRFNYSSFTLDRELEESDYRPVPVTEDEMSYRLGELLAHLGPARLDEAEAGYRQALGLNASHARAHAGLGWIASRRGAREEAIEHCETASAIEPNDFLISFRFGQALLGDPTVRPPAAGEERRVEMARIDRAFTLFNGSIRERPDFGEAYVGGGLALMKQGTNPEAAIRVLEGARHMLPARPDILVNLALLYREVGEDEQATRLIEEVLPRFSDRTTLDDARRKVFGADHDERRREASGAGDGAVK